MGMFTRRKWITFTLAAVILPISLLTAFKITGIISEPPIIETITLDTVSWNMTRPTGVGDVSIDQEVKSSYCTDASIESRIYISEYLEDWGRYGYNDAVAFGVYVTANITTGFIYSVVIKFSRVDTYSVVDIIQDPDMVKLRNLELTKIDGVAYSTKEGQVVAVALNNPNNCSLHIEVDWVLLDPSNQNHETSVTLEVTYFTGTLYKRIVIPIQLKVIVS